LRQVATRLVLFGALAIIVVGCAEPFEVTRQYVPKVKTPPPGDRLLAAMVPTGRQAWFFKLSGKKDLVEAQTKAFHGLLKSLTMKDGEPVWQTPDGWNEQPASGMRRATFVIGTKEEIDKAAEYSGNSADVATLECTVIPLPSIDVIANVNRWRKQIGLTSLLASELEPEKGGTGELNEFDLEDGTTVTWVNLEGNIVGGSGPPFASMAGLGPMQRGMPPNHPVAPNDNANPKGPAPAPAGPAGPPRVVKFRTDSIADMAYEIPTHWEQGPPKQFREKTWNIEANDQACEASISALGAAAGADSGLAANINRWRKQTGLLPLPDSEVKSTLDVIEVDGQKGHFAQIRGPRKTTLGIIVVQGSKAWFLKLTGDIQITANEAESFGKFVQSIRFK
jgi:hypothetical protein